MAAYYNEHDPKAAAWLRELIKEGHIAPGYVDERSILDVRPHELVSYTQQHFFAGVGGWSVALRLAGVPDSRPIRTGSCPCQPFSVAGKGLAEKDSRHLWPAFRDLIAFGEPTITFGEQVASKAGRVWLSRVRADLEALGYGVGGADLCAAGVGAPHPRQRIYWMAYPKERGRRQGGSFGRRVHARSSPEKEWIRSPDCCESRGLVLANGTGWHEGRPGAEAAGHRSSTESAGSNGAGRLADANGEQAHASDQGRLHAKSGSGSPWGDFDVLPFRNGKQRRVESGTFPLAHGVPGRVGLLRGYGNAIVPQVAAEFIAASLEAINCGI